MPKPPPVEPDYVPHSEIDFSAIRGVSAGPCPPHDRKDKRTWTWATCTRCGWYNAELEERGAMKHTIAVYDHCRDGCEAAAGGQLSLLAVVV